MTARQKTFVIFLLALLGFMNAGWLTVQTLGGTLGLACGPVGDCAQVHASKYARLFGIPTATLGFLMYGTLLVLAFLAGPGPNRRRTVVLLSGLALVGTLFSALLMYLQAFMVQAFCLFCTLSALLITVIWLVSLSLLKTPPQEEASPALEKRTGVLYVAYGLVVILFAVFLFSAGKGRSGGAQVVVRIGDEVITEAQMNDDIRAFIGENQRQLHQTKMVWLENALSVRLLRKEALRRNTTVPQIIAEAVGRVEPVTDSDIVAAGRAAHVEAGKLSESEKEYLRMLLLSERRNAPIQRLVDSLKKVYDVQILLGQPLASGAEFDLADSPRLGRDDAVLTVVVFTDFECPYCATVSKYLQGVQRSYSDRIRLVVKNFPLVTHPDAALAAEASLCANEQGKYWPYHDVLYANQGHLDRESLVSYAEKAGIDVPRFRQSLESGKYRGLVERDLREGEKIGVSATPTIFLNGRPLLGDLTIEQIDEAIGVALSQK